jgi:hypothetical protein
MLTFQKVTTFGRNFPTLNERKYAPMKLPLLITSFLFSVNCIQAQKVDSIYFHLYTDSLRKGTFNYINVDGKLSNGKWLPLTAKEISFSSSAGNFDGNSLFIDKNYTEEKVTIKVVLKEDPSLFKQVIIFIKKKEDNEKLKTKEEVMHHLS